MPLQNRQQTIINELLDCLFPDAADALTVCRDIVNEALSLSPRNPTRARNATENLDRYHLFACVAYPEMQFKRLEKQHSLPITVSEVQAYVVLYLIARLLHLTQSPDSDFDLETWLSQQPVTTPESKSDTPLTALDWLQQPHLQQQAQNDLSWDIPDTLAKWTTQRQQRCRPNQPEPRFQTYTPELTNWELEPAPARNFTAVINEREPEADEEGRQLDLTVTLEHPTNTVTKVFTSFKPYSTVAQQQQRIKQEALRIARDYARKETFLYLNRMLSCDLTFDIARPGLWLLTYRHYVMAVLKGQLDLGFFFTLTGEDRIQLTHPAIIQLHAHHVTDIVTLQALPAHTLQLFASNLYLEQACVSPEAFATLHALSPARCLLMLHPSVINLQKLGNLAPSLAQQISTDTIAIYADDFYFEAIRDGKIAADYYHPITPAHREFALHPRVITLIRHDRIALEKTHNLTIQLIRLINQPFYYYLLLQGHLSFEALRPWLDDSGVDYLRTLRGMNEIQKRLPENLHREEQGIIQGLLNFCFLHYNLDHNATIDPKAPGTLVLAHHEYANMVAAGTLSTTEILALSPRGADHALNPAIIPLVKKGYFNIAYAQHLSDLDRLFCAIPYYQEQLLKGKIDMMRLLAQTRLVKAKLMIPVVIQLQQLKRLTFSGACCLHTQTTDVLNDEFYAAGVLSGQFSLQALRYLSKAQSQHLLNPVIRSLLKAGAIPFSTARHLHPIGYPLLKILNALSTSLSPTYDQRLLTVPEAWSTDTATEFLYRLHLLHIHMTLCRQITQNPALHDLPIVKWMRLWIQQTITQYLSAPSPTLWINTFHYLTKTVQQQPDTTTLTFFAPRPHEKQQALQQTFSNIAAELTALVEKIRPKPGKDEKNASLTLRIP